MKRFLTLDLIHADNISHKEEFNMPNQIPNIKARLKNMKEIPVTQHLKLPINGEDIIKYLDVKPGPIIKQMLSIVEDAWLENPEITREDCFELLKKEYKRLYK